MVKILVKSYIRLIFFFHKKFKYKLKGLGKVQSLLRKEFTFRAFGKHFHYDPRIEGSYDYLLIGESNEPETRLFLDRLLPALDEFVFIDVGASIGEFINLVSSHENANKILAFEPRKECFEVLQKNAILNEEDRVIVINEALSDQSGHISFSLNKGGSSSGIYSIGSNQVNTVKVKMNRFDDLDILNASTFNITNYIVLIDVEGAEPLVLKGATKFIEEKSPLIIFEYNNTSKKYFNLKDIEDIIGENYSIFRLNGQGELDKEFENSWNCIAVPHKSKFEELLIN